MATALAPLFRPAPTLTYDSVRSGHRWRVPERMNIGVLCTDVHPPRRPAVITVGADGSSTVTTFGRLAELTDRMANLLESTGVRRGDRVGIVVPQSLTVLIAHLGAHKAGAVALPLATLFGPDALRFRLADSDARAVITTPADLDKVIEATSGLDLTILVAGDGPVAAPLVGLDDALTAASGRAPAVDTAADDPATLIYTSGTTGPPKGALHAHRFLIGHLPTFELVYELYPRPGDVIWTPADWAWIGALMDVVIPALAYGMPVVTDGRPRFDPDRAADLMASQRITSAFIPPTALKMMRAADVARTDLVLRAIFTGGESLGEETLTWASEALGAVINEGYGQTECNLVAGNCASVWPVRPGSMGRAMPGHQVAVIDAAGSPIVGSVGQIAVRRPDPVMMLGYWRRPDATTDKYLDDWLLTGDLGIEDEDGYLWFESRADDVISSAGYRIGPGEIEETLIGHPAVALAAAVGVPDEIRGEAVKAFVVLNEGVEPSPGLASELKDHVRRRLAAHEVPRLVEFRTELPMTTTGKIMRRALRDE